MAQEPDTALPKRERFAAEYLIDLNATQAAKRAGYSEASAYSQGQRLLKDAEVAAIIQKGMGKRAERTEITADRVLEEYAAIAFADPNELVQYRIGACAYCWGDPTPSVDEKLEAQPHGGALKRSNLVEGDLSNPTREPNPECEKCAGEGIGRAYVPDTRTLSPAARKLYAGVKVSRDGSVEVKMHDKAAALLQVGRHLGMFKEKIEHTHDISEEMQAWLNQRS